MISTDHLGQAFLLEKPPLRIVSLVPSITELLYDLGLANRIVGRTKFCIYPSEGFPKASIIGGTKNVHIDKVKALNPDLVIANKEENVKEQVEALSKFTNTFTTVIKDKEDAIKMIQDLGEITHTQATAEKIIQGIHSNASALKNNIKIKMVYLIWQDPYMTIGGDTFISNYMEDFGFLNCFKENLRYPSLSIEEIKQKRPDIILLSSEPFPFNDSHKEHIAHLTGIETQLVDGSYCSWYGSRMLKSAKYLRHMSNKLMKN